MGQVYRAHDTRLLRSVAIKFLAPGSVADEKARLRLLREAQTASQLNHPNICTVYDIHLSDTLNYIVMECVQGKSLREMLRDSGPLPELQVLDIAIQICTGLKAAHSHGILHRDIKPDNIMMTSDQQIKIMDFGLAKLKASGEEDPTVAKQMQTNFNVLKTSFSTLQGTASYMSPEQICKGDIDERTDIFSLGIVLFELLTGQLPFHGENQTSIMRSILRDHPDALRATTCGISQDLRQLILETIEKDKRNRPQRMDTLIHELLQIKKNRVHSDPAPVSGTVQTSKRRFFRAAVIASATLLLLVFVLFFYPHIDKLRMSRLDLMGSEISPDQAKVATIAIAPYWGVSENAVHEGRVMQALIERKLRETIGEEPGIHILDIDDVHTVHTHESAKVMGVSLEATVVVWGDIIVLRDEIEFQTFITISDSLWRRDDYSTYVPAIDLGQSHQINLRKSTAEEIVHEIIYLAALYQMHTPELALSLVRKIDPPTYQSLAYQSSIFISVNKWQEARQSIDSMLELFPDSLAHGQLGYYYLKRKQYDLAIKNYKIVLQDSNRIPSVYRALSIVFERMGSLDSAIYYGEKRLAVDTKYYTDYNHLGLVYAMTGQYTMAIQHHERAIELEPRFHKAYYDLATTRLLHDQYEEALAGYRHLLQRFPDYPWAYDMIGLIHLHQGHFRKAVNAYKKGIPLQPEDPRHLNGLAAAYMAWGKHKKAISTLQQATRMERQDDYVRILLFIELKRMGQNESAAAQLDTLLSRTKNDEWPASLLKFYIDIISADEVEKAAVKRHPQRDKEIKCEAYYYMGMAYLLGLWERSSAADTNRARDYFQKALTTGARDFFEYELARAELAKLNHSS